jgi:hypothetical protein
MIFELIIQANRSAPPCVTISSNLQAALNFIGAAPFRRGLSLHISAPSSPADPRHAWKSASDRLAK